MSVIEMDKKPLCRKVTRVGNSLGITIPSELVDAQNIKLGDEYQLCVGDNGDITLKRIPKMPNNVRPEVLELFAETLTEYEDVIRTLKDK